MNEGEKLVKCFTAYVLCDSRENKSLEVYHEGKKQRERKKQKSE